jgi:hypothetical protein
MPYIEGDDEARAAVQAEIRAGLATAQSAYQVTQVESAQFITEHGAQVLGGHSPVNAPGRMGDPDPTSDASDG